MRRTSLAVRLVVSIAAAVTVLAVTGRGVMLSPDSVQYLATAQSLHDHLRLTEFTGQPLTIFGPVLPILLAPGGASLGWARAVLAVSFAVGVWVIGALVGRRAGSVAGVVAAAALATSVALFGVHTTVWSEGPYIALSLAALYAVERLVDDPGARRWQLAAGICAGLGFLTRYAGAGLVLAVAVGVLAVVSWSGAPGSGTGPRGGVPRRAAVATVVAGAAVPIGAWVTRNLVVAGQPLGPRFSGGSPEPWPRLVRSALGALGSALSGWRSTGTPAIRLGSVATAGCLLATVVALWAVRRRRRHAPLDLAVSVYTLAAITLPIVARRLTASDIDQRVLTPAVPGVVVVACVAARALGGAAVRRLRLDAPKRRVLGGAVAALALTVWSAPTRRYVADFPRTLVASLGTRAHFDERIYDALQQLPTAATIVTNNPQRVWWFVRRTPTLFSFSRPRPGNSMYPLALDELLPVVCARPAYLGFFLERPNPTDTPQWRRPDLAAQIELVEVLHTDRGGVFQLLPRAGACPPNP